ncbi:carboxymuconolactone decarboxylase family protein, partial [Streptomyces sp. SID11233]|nr:carboxymuconolactone decarboxylase family protein [Streptomyces sp. SID11233]
MAEQAAWKTREERHARGLDVLKSVDGSVGE